MNRHTSIQFRTVPSNLEQPYIVPRVGRREPPMALALNPVCTGIGSSDHRAWPPPRLLSNDTRANTLSEQTVNSLRVL